MSLPSRPLSAEEFEEYRRRARRSPWLAYPNTCVPAILPWHRSTANYRVLSGPNNGGKTTAGAFEMVSYATGYNPIRDEHYDIPNICWAVCVEYKSAGNVMLRKLSEMLPRKADGSRAWTYSKQDHIIKLHAPYYSEIAIKSQKEGESSLLADRCTAIWVDEAAGGETGNENFGELQARGLPDAPLKMIFTLTPKLDIGIEWMHRKLWTDPKGIRPPHEDFIQDTFCADFELKDCLIENGGYITKEVYDRRLADTDPEEVAARIHGQWTPFYTKPAFSWGRLEKCMARAGDQRRVRFEGHGFGRRPILKEDPNGHGRLIRERESAHNYIAAWDPASGLGKGHDPSALVVFDRADLCQVFHARTADVGPEEFARNIAVPAVQYYNDALFIVENNGEGGGTAVSSVRDIQNLNLYQQKAILKSGSDITDRLGWITTDQSRHRIIESLLRALQEDKWTPSKDLIEEMSHVMKKPMPSGKYRIEHADGFHDDLVMAAGIALAVHYEEPVYEYPAWDTLAPKWSQPTGEAVVRWSTPRLMAAAARFSAEIKAS